MFRYPKGCGTRKGSLRQIMLKREEKQVLCVMDDETESGFRVVVGEMYSDIRVDMGYVMRKKVASKLWSGRYVLVSAWNT